MASASSPLQIAGDDDDFDWEAAVQEIDVACQATTENPTSQCDEEMVLKPAQELRKKGKNDVKSSLSSTRQATLDRFIKVSSSDLRKSVGNVEHLNGFCGNDSNGNVIFDKNDGCVANCEDTEMLNGFVKIDPYAAKTWIYPVNLPRRDYQFSITRTALFSNTLVVLPTGLGKTLIAAVVMYNFFRWFPEGKIVFAAPSRPLVTQQIEACHKLVGIPQEWTIDLTGQTSPTRRAEFWKCKRVFFVTPQVFEKDIQSGSCLVKHLVCLVIDEAHRATGNYSYCVAVRELMDTPVQLRILALSATPGSKQQTIQNVINNLQISTLEYRNESDPDVQPYVHDKKIELIQVAMGDEAVEINDLLLEVIRPFAARLSTFGVLQKRDIQTFSPCDLLNSRDKFRQEPPVGLPHTNYGVIEGYFGVLITLYHVRKLLSSHGIRPAFEMLDEKLKQGSFARLTSRNEVLLKAKLLMEQTISHGAPSPKLAKMLEVLTDHFKVKDPKNSRVIVFSNFRGSVRDILSALTNIGGIVKATEFIGQSSGKTLKGQSQKVQQAVLQKFRAGGYNVIVATSIGEEGLDIMEVDLVICFDANVSPLRMIQRMGRTGRKHAGRVVVLACEGSELKGYMRKLANSKTIKKHMINGGMNSFYFHLSPRMVPHVYKPEVQFLEMSIEEYVPRGKKMKDTDPVPSPACINKLTDAEIDLLSKYFVTPRQTSWKPSLIAFPHFQAFPSPVNKVLHSSRTGILIDTMQYLQGSTYSSDGQSLAEEEDILDPFLRVVAEEPHDIIIEDSERSNDPSEEKLIKEVEGTGIETDEITKGVYIEDFHKPTLLSDSKRIENDKTASACHLMHDYDDHEENHVLPEDSERCNDPSEEKLIKEVEGTGIDTEDIAKDVLVEDFHKPTLSSNSKRTENNMASAWHLMHDYDNHEENHVLSEGNPSSHPRSPEVENVHESSPCIPDSENEEQFSGAEGILHTPVSSRMNSEMDLCAIVHDSMPTTPAHESSDDFIDPELSPRLTNFIKSGVVPESPVNNPGTCNGDGRNFIRPALISSQKLQTEILRNSWKHDEKELKDGSLGKTDVLCLSDDDTHTPVIQCHDNAGEACPSAIPVAKECQTPLAKPSDTSKSEDWLLDTGEKPETVEQRCKLRRLRKLGDLNRKIPPESGGRTGPGQKHGRDNHTSTKLVKGAKKRAKHAAVYIEEEAEVSSEGMESDDDEDVVDNSSYEDSFIDDGVNPTSASTQAGSTRPDMMAIYRRSLLTQSPFQSLPNTATMVSPNSAVQSSRMDGSGSSSATRNDSTPQTGLLSAAGNSQFASNGIPTEMVQNNLECRKRKLSFYNQAHSVPAVNLDKEFSVLSETACGNSSMKIQVQRNEESGDMFDVDDQFYEGIDLDAVEQEATMLLRKKSECSIQKTAALSEPIQQNFGILESPSFDLGI